MLDPFAVAAIRLLILTGARLREILHARWEHVDFERGVIFLPDSKTGKKPIYLSAAPWAAVIKAAGLDDLRIHDLRHSFASFGAGASLGLPIIGKLPEERRVEAVRTCLELYSLRSRQLDKGRGEILADIEREAGQANVEVRLRNFVASIASAIFLSNDPEKALTLILHGHPRKGAKKKNDYRDFMIAADVEERKRKGETLDAAYDAVRDALGKEMAARGPDAVRRIHARLMKDPGKRLEVEAELTRRKRRFAHGSSKLIGRGTSKPIGL
jgi:hypothetical protein